MKCKNELCKKQATPDGHKEFCSEQCYRIHGRKAYYSDYGVDEEEERKQDSTDSFIKGAIFGRIIESLFSSDSSDSSSNDDNKFSGGGGSFDGAGSSGEW